jgi:hypothetical protein
MDDRLLLLDYKIEMEKKKTIAIVQSKYNFD